MTGARAHRQVDGSLLSLDLARALVLVGVREVRREAHHRRDLAGCRHRVHDRRHVTLVVAREELVIVLDALAAERGRVVNPGDVVPPAGDELVEVTLGEDGNGRPAHGYCQLPYIGLGSMKYRRPERGQCLVVLLHCRLAEIREVQNVVADKHQDVEGRPAGLW